MRITEAQLRGAIRKALLSEEVFGAQAFVYHGSRTPPEKFASIIESDAFDPGGAGGDMYGKGLYTVYEADERSNTFTGAYGEHVYKLKVSLSGFLILDPEVAQKVFGKWVGINEQLRKMGLGSVVDQLRKKLGPAKSQRLDEVPADFTSKIANSISDLVSPHVRGLVFTGLRDGQVALVYDPASVVLVAHKAAGESEWKGLAPGKGSISRSAGLSFTPGRYNYPVGRSTKTAEVVRSAAESAGLPWDDYHEDRILDANEGLDKLRAANPEAWKRAVERHIRAVAADAEGEMPEGEIEGRVREALASALKRA